MSKNIANFEAKIGYKFQNIALLERAFTHRSWAYERIPFGEEEEIRLLQNESLEFIGDSVLGLAIAEQLYNLHPRASEGDLTLMKHYLVSMGTLAKISQTIGLSDYMRVGRGEEKTGGRSKQALLANTLEAVIAAIFFDSGYISARAFVNRIFVEEFRSVTPRTSIDYKTLLQETLQANKQPAPIYKVVNVEGPPHKRFFLVEAVWGNEKVIGKGSSKKSAEMMAANLALDKINKDTAKSVKKG
ncbi:MAG: ribonuclease III [Acidobacteria bacterium]|nr:ribonuclease III [Acidobacteriota bacterium]MCA1639275.1 ribonuclease III [Acidobacteriota bacterium]